MVPCYKFLLEFSGGKYIVTPKGISMLSLFLQYCFLFLLWLPEHSETKSKLSHNKCALSRHFMLGRVTYENNRSSREKKLTSIFSLSMGKKL